jgi:hypothetical protein
MAGREKRADSMICSASLAAGLPTQQVTLPLRAYGAAALARLDYQVSGVAVQAAAAAARGNAVPLSVDLTCTGQSPPGRHVVRVEVLAPDGQRQPFYTQNVDTRSGQWRGKICTAFNDPPGLWTVQAREVLSGKTATTQFQLK